MQIQLSGPTAAGSGGASGGMAGPCLPTHLITSVNTLSHSYRIGLVFMFAELIRPILAQIAYQMFG